jgi:hypothetical protein
MEETREIRAWTVGWTVRLVAGEVASKPPGLALNPWTSDGFELLS